MDVFSWSIPFVVEKVTEILLRTGDPKIVGSIEEEKAEVDIQEKLKEGEEKSALSGKADLLRKKVRVMSRMFKMLKTIREEKETITRLKGLCPDNKVPRGLILSGGDAIKDALDQFSKAKEFDQKNEAMPDSFE